MSQTDPIGRRRRPAGARRAAVRRRAGRARGRRRPAPPAELAALAVGGRDLPARRHARRRHRASTPKYLGSRRLDRDRRRDAGHRPGAAAARRPRHRQDLASASTSRPRSAGPRRWSSRARPAPPRSRCATAGTTPGCSPTARRRAAMVPSPVMRAMETGALVRVEELTRIPADVQDALITILSEKTLPVPELDDRGAGPPGLQRHRHRQQPRQGRQRPVLGAQAPLQHRGPAAARHRRAGGRDRPHPRRRARRVACQLPADLEALGEIERVVHGLPRAALGRHRRPAHHHQVAVRDPVDRRGDLGDDQRRRPGRPLRRRRGPRRRRRGRAASARW